MGASTPVGLPVGVVTLLFSDIEGSTRLLQELGDAYGEVLSDHYRLLREAWLVHGGVEVDTEGDAFFVAFAAPGQAVRAAVAAQRALAAHQWRDGLEVRVRMGVHTGSPRVRGTDYWGIDVHYAARLCAAAHGGQVLVSESTAALVDLELEDLGKHAVKDFPSARRIFHLPVDGLGSALFPPAADASDGADESARSAFELYRARARAGRVAQTARRRPGGNANGAWRRGQNALGAAFGGGATRRLE
jgi:class 3 adenylate cyclase